MYVYEGRRFIELVRPQRALVLRISVYSGKLWKEAIHAKVLPMRSKRRFPNAWVLTGVKSLGWNVVMAWERSRAGHTGKPARICKVIGSLNSGCSPNEHSKNDGMQAHGGF